MTFKVKDGVQVGSTLVLDSNGYLTTRLATARTIALSGDVSGSASFDGSANINITATVADDSHSHSNYLTGESDTLASVTARGASTGTAVTLSSGGNQYSGHFYYLPHDAAGNHYPHFNDGGNASGSKINWRLFTGGTNSITHYWGVDTALFNTKLESSSRIDAPILYDRNDTNFYLDPNGTSNVSGDFRINHSGSSGLRLLSTTGTQSLWIRTGWDSAPTPSVSYNNVQFQSSGSSGGSFTFWSGNTLALTVTSDYAQGAGSLRAPIFYDTNDTGYYTDPASTSYVYDINTRFINFRSHFDNYGPGYWYANDTATFIQTFNTSAGNPAQFNIRHSYGDTILENARGWTYIYGSAVQTNNSLRAPIFYDSNDTSWYMDPGSTSQFNRIYANNKYHRFGTSDSWDSVGQGSMTNVHFQGHDHFWIGAGNGTWYTGSANSGLPSGTSVAHDLLLTTMYSDADYYRGITFATENTGAANNGWRLGKWYSGTGSMQNSRLIVDGQIFAKGNHPDEYDFYANNYDSYRNSAAWVGDSGAGWHNASIVAARAIQIQSGNAGTSSAKPQLQFHQYGYGGPSIEYDGPNNKLRIGDVSGANRMSHLDIYSSGGYGPLRMNHDQIWTPSGNLHFQYSSGGNIDMNYGGGHTFSRTSLRSPIFYDFDNTGYYCDPNNTSNLNITQTASLNLGNSSTYRFSTSEWAGAGGWPGYTYTGGDHRFGFSSTSGKIDLWTDGIMYAIESHRSPIFYDYNDTAYYVDPASFTYLYGGIYNNGAHGNSSIVNRLLASNNGAATGEVRLQMWCSEPGNTWDGAGFGYNVDNNSNANAPAYYFGRPNASFGQAYMRMTTNGYWYFYTSNTSGTRYTNMTMQSDGNTTFGGSITASGNVTAYSDARLKDNVETVKNALDITRNLRGVFYTRKDDHSNTRRVGVIAQEIQEYLPEVVYENIAEQEKSDAISTLTVDYGNITGLLIEAIKEQQDIIESQESRIARLEALVQQLIGD